MRRYIYGICLMASVYGAASYSNSMVTNTAQALNKIRSAVLHDAKEQKKLMNMPAWMVQFGMAVTRYDSEMRSNAIIARPFFVVKNADSCLSKIGSTEADLAYLKSVFEEFYASGARTLPRLISILHNHMMRELNFKSVPSLAQFKGMMEKTNKHGFPTVLNDAQFTKYARCVARGLYAYYWVEHSCS